MDKRDREALDRHITGNYGEDQFKNRSFKKPTKKQPSLKTLEKWDNEGFCRATDGCKVEPDGCCSHGHVSWLIYLNLI